jgi:hypothetical protein
MKCPSSDSPRIAFVPGTSSVAAAPSSCVSSMSVGATTCMSCPVNCQYTWSDKSKTVNDCKQCPKGQFFSSATSSCRLCKAQCNRPYFYETVPCTETTDRQCAACGLEDSCDPVGEYLLPGNAGCPGPIDAGLFFYLFILNYKVKTSTHYTLIHSKGVRRVRQQASQQPLCGTLERGCHFDKGVVPVEVQRRVLHGHRL